MRLHNINYHGLSSSKQMYLFCDYLSGHCGSATIYFQVRKCLGVNCPQSALSNVTKPYIQNITRNECSILTVRPSAPRKNMHLYTVFGESTRIAIQFLKVLLGSFQFCFWFFLVLFLVLQFFFSFYISSSSSVRITKI